MHSEIVGGYSESLQSLDAALLAGQARFERGAVQTVELEASRGGRRLKNRLERQFAYFPGVNVNERAVTHELSGRVFCELALGGHRYLVGCDKVAGVTLAREKAASIVTGVCLFGSESLTGKAEDGRTHALTDPDKLIELGSRIVSIEIDDRLHVYEAETVARLSGFICDLAKEFDAPVRVWVHVPVPEYEVYGFDLYARGLLSYEALTDYRRAVRRRGAVMRQLLAQQLQSTVTELEFVSPLARVVDIDTSVARLGEVPEMLYHAAGLRDDMWRSLLDDREERSLLDLNHLSYIYQYLAIAKRAQARGEQFILVENPDETPIFRHALKEQERVGVAIEPAAGFYVHPETVVIRVTSGLVDYILYNCSEGCDPDNVAAALRANSATARV